MDIDTTWRIALVSCTPSQSEGLVLGCALFWCWVLLCVPFTNSLIEFNFIMIVVTVNGIFVAILFILNYIFRLSVLCKCAPPWMFPSLEIGFEYRIKLVTFGFLYFMFRFCYRIFYRGVPGFATDCPCGDVWCRESTTCPLHAGPHFGYQFWNDSGVISLT